MEFIIKPEDQLKKQIKWVLLVKGIVAILIGAFMLFKPTTSLALVMMYIGVFWLIDGVSSIYSSIKSKSHDKNWIWSLIFGVVSAIAAIMIFAQPTFAALISSSVLVTVIGIVILTIGVLSIVSGAKKRKINGDSTLLISGILAAIFGLILVGHPLIAVYTFLIILGILLIIGGILISVLAFSIKFRKKILQ